jgi:hypothetical protein
MRQGRKVLSLAVALAVLATAIAPLTAPRFSYAAGKSAAAGGATKTRNSLRQFTGFVTAVDQNSITVEKHGKKPQTRVFARPAEMKTTGDLEKDAHVTVYYRDEGGRSVARRVVVKQDEDDATPER